MSQRDGAFDSHAVEWAVSLPGVDGALAIMGDRMAAAGDIELARLY